MFSTLYVSFGVLSPFFPAFLLERGLLPQQIGLVLAIGMFLRLIAGPVAGYLADLIQGRRIVLATCSLFGAAAACAMLPTYSLPILIATTLFHAAALTPTSLLADSLALRAANQGNCVSGKFEYGWVRGAGSFAFIVGTLMSGWAVGSYGISPALAAQVLGLTICAYVAFLVPEIRQPQLPPAAARGVELRLLAPLLFRNRPFGCLIAVAAIVSGSHAMHDGFAMIAWNAAGISPSYSSVLWSVSVLGEVAVFFVIGPLILKLVTPQMAMIIAAVSAAFRWTVMAQSSDVVILAMVESLHGFSFALLHLACMRILVRVTPFELAATAQAVYGFGTTLVSAIMTLICGHFYAKFGQHGFFLMSAFAILAIPFIWLLSDSLRTRAGAA